MLKDKHPTTLEEVHEQATWIEANLSSSKVEAFYAPRGNVETKPTTLYSTKKIQDIDASLSQGLEEAIWIKNQKKPLVFSLWRCSFRRNEYQMYARKKNISNDPRFPQVMPSWPSSNNPSPQPTSPKNDDINMSMANILGRVRKM
jgi:hypothetical protein